MLIGRQAGLERGVHRLEVLGAVVEVLGDLVLLLARRRRGRPGRCRWRGGRSPATRCDGRPGPGRWRRAAAGPRPPTRRRSSNPASFPLDRRWTVGDPTVLTGRSSNRLRCRGGLRAAGGRRSAPPRGARVAGRQPVADRPPARRGGLRGAALAEAVGPRRRPDPPDPDRRGAGGRRGASPVEHDRHRLGRAHDRARRHRGAEGALPVPAAGRRGDLVPALQRARLRVRPGVARHPGRARRRRVGRERPEDLDVARPALEARHPHRPHRPRRAEARGHLVLHLPDGHARASRSARSSR